MNSFSCCEICVQRYLTVCSISCNPKCLETNECCVPAAKYSPASAHRGEVSLKLSQALYAFRRSACEAFTLIVSSTALARSAAKAATSGPAILIRINRPTVARNSKKNMQAHMPQKSMVEKTWMRRYCFVTSDLGTCNVGLKDNEGWIH